MADLIQRLSRGLALGAVDVKKLTGWPQQMVEDYLSIRDNFLSVAETFISMTEDLVTQLSDLSDVSSSTPNDKNVLVANGTSWVSRPLVDSDLLPDQVGNEGEFLQTDGSTSSWGTPILLVSVTEDYELASAVTTLGVALAIKNDGTEMITVSTAGSETIDDEDEQEVGVDDCMTVLSDTANWSII